VRLFLQRAARERAEAATPTAIAGALRICRAVEGMPLALDLAAGWAGTLALDDLADEIERDLDLLVAGVRSKSDRQRSVTAVLEASLARLGDAARRAFEGLGAFPGSFDRAAAAREAHARHDAAWLLASEPALHGTAPAATLAQLDRERDNVMAAWRWHVADRDVTTVPRLAKLLETYLGQRTRFAEGVALFGGAAEVFDVAGDDAARAVAGGLLVQSGWLAFRGGRYQEALGLVRLSGPAVSLARSLNNFGLLLLADERPEEAEPVLREGLDLALAIEALQVVPHLLGGLAKSALARGDCAAARANADEASRRASRRPARRRRPRPLWRRRRRDWTACWRRSGCRPRRSRAACYHSKAMPIAVGERNHTRHPSTTRRLSPTPTVQRCGV